MCTRAQDRWQSRTGIRADSNYTVFRVLEFASGLQGATVVNGSAPSATYAAGPTDPNCAIDVEAIPRELRDSDQWVDWKL